MQKIKVFLFFSFIGFFSQIYAQNLNIPLQNDFSHKIEAEIIQNQMPIHSTFLPLNESQLNSHFNSDSILYYFPLDTLIKKSKIVNFLRPYLRTDNLVDIHANDYRFIINPLFNFSFDQDLNSKTWINNGLFSVNTRGVEVRGNITNKVSFYTCFYENQAYFVDYLNEFARTYLVVPGQGTRKNFGAKGHDYAIASGYLSFSPFKTLNLQIGSGKNFIGNGYRSLLLSDNSTLTPYFKAQFNYKKLQYVYLLTQNQAHYTNFLHYRYRSGGSYNYLSYLLHKRIEISFFEGLTSVISDSSSLTNYKFSYFNPVIFSRTAAYGLNNENNIILGANLKLNISKQSQVYAQFMLDNFALSEKNKPNNARYGYQIGAKYFNLLSHFSKAENHNLYIQAEYNAVTPYSYSSHSAWQNYSNLNQSLAHPLNSNFKEMLGILSYQWKNLLLELKYTYAIKGEDFNALNYGGNIFTSNDFEFATTFLESFTGKIGQGLETIIQNKTLNLAFIVNPRTRMQIFTSLNIRQYENHEIVLNSKYISFGFKTNLRNFYYDF